MSRPDLQLRPRDDDVEQRLHRIREHRASAVAPAALRWLALLPEWTCGLASACNLPGGGDALRAAHRAGLCEVPPGEGEPSRFWLKDEIRSWLLAEWERLPEIQIELDIVDIAHGILAADDGEVRVSPGILRWAQLAQLELGGGDIVTGEALAERVRECLEREELSDAFDWIFAGESLSPPLGARMGLATARAKRRISLHYRRELDARYLEGFVRREDQMRTLVELADSEDEWAIHFLGPAGIGKTMLMRFVSSGLPDNPFGSASRIDFDYIDPRLPLENPAALLRGLAEDFELDLDGARDGAFRSFLEAVTEAEAERPGTGPATTRLPPHGTPQFNRAISAFARLLGELPQPPVLVLDTCEELAKLHPPGERMHSISATVAILRRLHQKAPTLRVIVAGRRWLTSRYANEERDDDAVPESVRAMEPFEFMWLHDIRGFTESEVNACLRVICGGGVGDRMLAAVLENTIDESSAPASGAEGEAGRRRYSPNDVGLIAKWLRERPDLDPATLEAGDFDAYLEARIFRRLSDPAVLDAVPIITLLERFDGKTIEPMLGPDKVTRRQTLAALIDLDWTHLEGGPDPESMVLKVDPGLLRRLRDYYDGSAKRRQLLASKRKDLCEHLQAVFERPPGVATIEGIDAALRLLPPEEAAFGFDRMAERVAREPAWEWAEELCERLLSPDREPPLGAEMWASAWALYLASLRHAGATVDMSDYWRGVEHLSGHHPNAPQARELAARGRLGALTDSVAADKNDDSSARAALARGRLVLDRASPGSGIAHSLLAAIEVLVDAQEERSAPLPVEAVEVCLIRLRAVFEDDRGLRAYVLTLVGRVHWLAGRRELANEDFKRVARIGLPAATPMPLAADWVSPHSIAHRVMLEELRFRLLTGRAAERFLERCETFAAEGDGGIDAKQLFSLALQARLADGCVGEELLERGISLDEAVEDHGRVAPGHRSTPPLFVSLAEGWLAIGDASRALTLLLARERRATSRRTDEQTTRAATLATVKVLRRLRLRERMALIVHSQGGDPELRAEALAAGALIAGLQPRREPSQASDHAAWRALILLDGGKVEEVAEPSQPAWQPAGSDAATVEAALDRLESNLVRQRLSRLPGESPEVNRSSRQVEYALAGYRPRTSPSDPLREREIRLGLRAEALLGRRPKRPEDHDRLCGRLALEEGELMALRAPDRAVRLFAIAQGHLDRAGDRHLGFVTRLLTAVTEIRAGLAFEAEAKRREILRRYEEVRAENRSLPPPWLLVDDRSMAEALDSDDPWRGWVWRLSYYLRWCGGGRPDFDEVLGYGPEFALAAARGFDSVRAPRTRARTREIVTWRPAQLALPLVLTTLTIAALIQLMPWVALAALAVVATVIAIEGVGPSLPLRVLPVSGFDVSILAPPLSTATASSELIAANVAARPWSRSRPMQLYLDAIELYRRPATSVVPVKTANGTPLRSKSRVVAQMLREQVGGGYPQLRLRVDPELAHISWERRFCADLVGVGGEDPKRLPNTYRIRPIGREPSASTVPLDVSAICGPLWSRFLESSTEHEITWVHDIEGIDDRGQPHEHAAPGVRRSPRPIGRAQIALGTPVMTSAGWRLRIDDEDLFSFGGGPSAMRTQRLLSPDLLARQGSLVVIVGRPDGNWLTDTGVSDGLRGLGNEVFLAGTRGVLSVPVLPPKGTAAAVGLLVSEVQSWTCGPHPAQLRKLGLELHRLILTDTAFDGSSDKRRIELALDVCLFCPVGGGHD